MPTNVVAAPATCSGCPKLMSYAKNIQMTRVIANAYTTISAELTANFRFINPAYRIARPGMLMIPTSVADVSCHAVSPEFSQLGSGFRVDSIAIPHL